MRIAFLGVAKFKKTRYDIIDKKVAKGYVSYDVLM